MKRIQRPASLRQRLKELEASPPDSWAQTGRSARPNLHGLLRYPAMMVPRMQGDILDVVLGSTSATCRITDPFVGSGTTMTEAMIRGLDFTGVDINPLAVMVCEAKAAIDGGLNVHSAIQTVLLRLSRDTQETIDVNFPGIEKWFDKDAAIYLSKIRRSILAVADQPSRKVLWTVFADTLRLTSNSRTSTYKLHVRPDGDRVSASRIAEVFRYGLKELVDRAEEYIALVGESRKRQPKYRIICGDVRTARIPKSRTKHDVLVTSPPYGDNRTTIPYGQFSYLAVSWIPEADLPEGWDHKLARNYQALDSASLGGSNADFESKHKNISEISPSYVKFMRSAARLDRSLETRKVATFLSDYLDAFTRVKSSSSAGSHWIVTTGNRRAANLLVPLDEISVDIVHHLGGKCIASIRRALQNKRMPSRNSIGEMITAETTLVAEFR